MTKFSKRLKSEFDGFKNDFNENKLQEIFEKTPNDLLDDKSELNLKFTDYKKNVDEMLIINKSFNKYIQDMEGIMKKLSTPDCMKYKSWNISQIVLWIRSLEEGKYSKYYEILENGFKEGEIIGSDLPEISSSDLASPPFNIKNFRVKKDLVKHFKSLLQPQQKGIENEGAPTAYIG